MILADDEKVARFDGARSALPRLSVHTLVRQMRASRHGRVLLDLFLALAVLAEDGNLPLYKDVQPSASRPR